MAEGEQHRTEIDQSLHRRQLLDKEQVVVHRGHTRLCTQVLPQT